MARPCGREGNGTPLQYSCLENPMDRGAWKAAVHGVAEGRTRLSDFTFTFHFHALEKEMATHSSVLAWRIPGMAEPGGLPSMGSHRVGYDWSDLAVAAGLVGSLGKWEAISGWCRYWLQGHPMVYGSFWAFFAFSLSLAFFVCSSAHNWTWLPLAQCYLTLQGQIWKARNGLPFLTCLLEWQLQTLTPWLLVQWFMLNFLFWMWAQMMGELRLSLLSAKSGIVLVLPYRICWWLNPSNTCKIYRTMPRKCISAAAAAAAKSLQSCLTLFDPWDGSPLGSAVPGILQARTLEWVCHFLLQCMKVKSESEVAQ